ncbi:RHS repeat protein [Salmonella enterica]|uniref:RHS repeat protein n=2 Tax=Salmonella enterica subsp. salamae TaxID=59202 RepID=A0A735HM24_SALER|nr:RHS repeat protein [Salmonella enterica]HAE6918718.1 RHS repeat protein [Salmonella enterica subsp. salamae serovar 47:b:1,5]EAX8729781.1 RHS repeat protein [Salmonella enterica]EBA0248157.1 RHS repeat protein [Salmonella enterica]EBC1927196.1 RHS repeat protein [Salmonella enterica]
MVRYVRTQYGETQAEGRYIYDPTGRRVGKRVWKREPVHWSETRTELSARPYETWYGWEGDRLATIRTQQRRVQTVYEPGSFTPLLRVETENTELAKTRHRSLAEKLEQEGSGDGEAVQFPAALRAMLDRLEDELRRDAVSEESRAWLTQCGLTAEQMKNQLEPRPEPERKLHLYHCDHRGLPLISPANTVAWRAEYDEWGNLLSEENPEHLEQLIRLPGQQYHEESGLHYNRHRYYSPGQGRYITQDPIGLMGGWNLYLYPLDSVSWTDSMGLAPNKYGHMKNGGYGARPTPPPKPNPGKMPGIAEKLMPNYPIDQASSEPNVFKTFFNGFSPYDYTLYCKKWVKPNLIYTPWDDPKYPGMDTKTAIDYLPKKNWAANQLPEGYSCAEPYLFPDLNELSGPATAGIDDLGELWGKISQRTRRGGRK